MPRIAPSPGFVVVEICILGLAIVATAFGFRGRSATSAVFLIPYLAWKSFAGLFNLYYLKTEIEANSCDTSFCSR